MSVDYNPQDLKNSIKKLNLKKNDTIYITGNLSNFGRINLKNHKVLPQLIFKNLLKIIGKGGTIVVPTHSFKLVNSKKIFDPKKTPCETGSFSSFILKQKNCFRQIHPYSSSAAIGKNAKYICTRNSKNVYGPRSPFDRMIKLNTKFISLGMKINNTCSQVHHAEFNMNVPYRFKKFFSHRVRINRKVAKKIFYMFVLKENFLKIKRNKNKKIINFVKKKQDIIKQKLGCDYIYCYDLKTFYQSNLDLLRNDKFCWLGYKPKKL